MTVFSGDFEALKHLAKEFHEALKTVETFEELNAGWKCLGVSYLEFNPSHAHETAGAAALMRIMSREYLQAQFDLSERLRETEEV